VHINRLGERVGNCSLEAVVMAVKGKLNVKNAFKQRLQELGIQMVSEVDVNTAFAKFKESADRK
jgi:isopropylmalate/homocitrate/citramalate synthase